MERLDYVLNLMRFAFKANPMLYLSVVVSLVSVAIELLAMSSLLPLFTIISGGGVPEGGMISEGLRLLGFQVDGETLLWVFIVLLAIRLVTQLAGQSLSIYLGKRVMAQLSSQAFSQIMHNLSILDISRKSIGFYTSLSGDEAFRASTLVISLTQFTNVAALSLLYFIAISHYSPVVAVLIVVFMLCSSAVLYWVLKISHRMGERQILESRKAHSVFLDSMNNLKTVRALSAETYVVDMYRSIIFGYTKILSAIDVTALLTRLVPVLLLLMMFAIWIAGGGHAITSVGLAFIVTMIAYLMRFFPTVGQGVNLLIKIASDARSGRDVTAILRAASDVPEGACKHIDAIKTIEFRNVDFSYEIHGSKNVLSGVVLKVERGKSYALVGRSGVGKSTLVDILLKFYLPTSGDVYFNSDSAVALSDAAVRKKLILVSQEAAIFDDTVTNNICMGMSATPEEIRQACELACIDDVIDGMPDGYETRLQYQGKNLSGGQRQRIAIARALLRKPEVLILDESTSALDKPTQERVVENILQTHANKIIIFVTHDPYIMQHVDEVLNLEEINASASCVPGSDHENEGARV